MKKLNNKSQIFVIVLTILFIIYYFFISIDIYNMLNENYEKSKWCDKLNGTCDYYSCKSEQTSWVNEATMYSQQAVDCRLKEYNKLNN